MLSWDLNTSTDGDPTVSLENLRLLNSWFKKSFLLPKGNFMLFVPIGSCRSPQVFIYTVKILLNLVFSRLKQPQHFQPLIEKMLQPLNHLLQPILDSPHKVQIFLVLVGSELDTALHMQPQQCRAEGKEHLSGPAANALPCALLQHTSHQTLHNVIVSSL